jgi:hypothetical protein
MYFNRKYDLVGRLFQGPYNAKCVRSKEGLVKLLEYVRNNPVEASIVDRGEDYEWLEILV